ncbi:MAG: hypothetical protein MZV65_35425 [Chromatiales bacterium]|nr:hypothetical protein [Chromatiales bacterium]
MKFSLMDVLRTNTICWKAFEQAGSKGYGFPLLSWMFHHDKIDWEGAAGGEYRGGEVKWPPNFGPHEK